jgi:hypothetical protein
MQLRQHPIGNSILTAGAGYHLHLIARMAKSGAL